MNAQPPVPSELATVALDVDFIFVGFVIFVVCLVLFIALWGVAQSSASKADVAALSAKVSGLEHKVDLADGRVAEVERKISTLPTSEQVHQIDVRVERVAAHLDSIGRQTDRIHEFLMADARHKEASAQ